MTLFFANPDEPLLPNNGNEEGGGNTPVGGGAPIGGGIAVLLCLSVAYGGKKSLQFI
ncbi:MAG: hypothetical protein ACOX5O_02795 [Bacteroidales bacterium]|nr:hypothetical protein [Bacteroidales bacterium]